MKSPIAKSLIITNLGLTKISIPQRMLEFYTAKAAVSFRLLQFHVTATISLLLRFHVVFGFPILITMSSHQPSDCTQKRLVQLRLGKKYIKMIASKFHEVCDS